MPMRKRRSNGVLSLLSPFLWAALALIVLIGWQIMATLRHDTIFEAIRRNDSEAVNRFLHIGTDVNMRESLPVSSFSDYMNQRFSKYVRTRNQTPLLAALYSRRDTSPNQTTIQYNSHPNIIIIRALLEHGADVHAMDENSTTPLTFAAVTDDVAIVDLLVQHGAKVNEQAAFNQGTPLMTAASMGRVKVLRYLLEHGADINATDASGGTALTHTVIHSRQTDAVRLLLERRINVNAKDNSGKTALWYAKHPNPGLSARQTQHLPEIIMLLKQAGAK